MMDAVGIKPHIQHIVKTLYSKRTYLLYSIVVISSGFLGVAKYGIFANILGVKDFGVYSLVLTSYVFVIYVASFGVNEFVLKLGGRAFGRGHVKDIADIRNIALFNGFISMVTISTIVISISSLMLDSNVIEILVFTTLVAISALLFSILESYFRAKQKAIFFATMLFIKSTLLLSVGSFLGQKYGVYGILVSEVIAFMLVFILFFLISDRGAPPRFRNIVKDFYLIIDSGMQLLSSMFFRLIALLAERWAVTYTLGIAAVGKYAFLMITYQIGVMGLGLITNIVGPKWLAKYSKNHDVVILLNGINKVAIMMFLLALILFMPVTYIFTYIVEVYYPDYNDIALSQMFLYVYLGVTLLCICQLYDWYFIAVSKEHMLNSISFLMFILSFIGVVVVAIVGATLLRYFILFLVLRVIIALFYIYAVVTVWDVYKRRSV